MRSCNNQGGRPTRRSMTRSSTPSGSGDASADNIKININMKKPGNHTRENEDVRNIRRHKAQRAKEMERRGSKLPRLSFPALSILQLTTDHTEKVSASRQCWRRGPTHLTNFSVRFCYVEVADIERSGRISRIEGANHERPSLERGRSAIYKDRRRTQGSDTVPDRGSGSIYRGMHIPVND